MLFLFVLLIMWSGTIYMVEGSRDETDKVNTPIIQFGIFFGSLKYRAKVKIFIWKSLHGIVPGNAILADRHIPISGQCPVCAQGSEDIQHLIFTCDRAREVWTALGLKEVSENSLVVDRSGSVVLEEILCRNIQTPTHLGHVQ
jgi:hypothetical protein